MDSNNLKKKKKGLKKNKASLCRVLVQKVSKRGGGGILISIKQLLPKYKVLFSGKQLFFVVFK